MVFLGRLFRGAGSSNGKDNASRSRSRSRSGVENATSLTSPDRKLIPKIQKRFFRRKYSRFADLAPRCLDLIASTYSLRMYSRERNRFPVCTLILFSPHGLIDRVLSALG
jgi:hypothetical protein